MIANQDSLIAHGPTSLVVPTLEFDGFTFHQSYSPTELAPLLSMLHLAALARRGDAMAAEVLKAGRVTIRDVNQRTYWPMETATEQSHA